MSNTAVNTLEFGANYLPHVDSIRDFYPHWIEPRWDEARVTRDLKILRSLGSRWMRYHILPTDYTRDRYPAAEAEMYRRLVPHALRTCRELGMKTHVDLHTDDFRSLRAEHLLARIDEFGGENIDVLQVINEYFYLWKNKENLDHLEALLTAIRASGFGGHLCFDAGGEVHRHIRQSHPKLAEFVSDLLPMHHYTYGIHWDDLGIDTFLDLLTNGRRALERPLLPEQRKYWEGMVAEHFAGLAKRLHVMEVNSVGFHIWNGIARGGRAARWPEMMRRIAAETDVRVVAHWCFRTKMSWREYGSGMCGLLYPSEIPRDELRIFRQVAMEMMPDDDVYAHYEVNVAPAAVGRMSVTVVNKTARPAAGRVIDDLGNTQRVIIPARSAAQVELPEVPRRDADVAVVHQIVEFIPDDAARFGGRCIGWCAYAKPRPVRLSDSIRFAPAGVEYPDGIEPVARFLEDYRNRLVIVFEHPGCLESELGARLQCALAEGAGIHPELAATTQNAADVLLDRALIVPMVRGQSAFARCVERLVGSRYAAFRTPGATISAHPGLFSKPPAEFSYPAASVTQTIGDVSFSPGALIVIGSSFETLRDAVHDLIQRLAPTGPTARKYEQGERERYGGMLLTSPRTFAVAIPTAEYKISLAVGSCRFAEPTATRIIIPLAGIDQSFRNHGDLSWLEHRGMLGGILRIEFAPLDGLAACPTALVITDCATGARVFKGYFHHAPRVDMDYDGYRQIGADRLFGQSHQAADWANIKSAENEFVAEASAYGWVEE